MEKTNLVSLNMIKEAREFIKGKVRLTPLIQAPKAVNWGGQTQGLNFSLYVKAELFQEVGSFKLRGVLNNMGSLSDDAKKRGIITISAGNHAQSTAYAAKLTGLKSLIIMPHDAPKIKIENTKNFGAEVMFAEMTELLNVMEVEMEKRNMTLVHPFDHLHTIAGTGTIGLEISEQFSLYEPDKAPDYVVVPIGGGGLISGISAAIKLLHPNTKVIGVEPEGAKAMTLSLASGKPETLDRLDTVADGLAAPFVGSHNLRHVQEFVDQVVIVTDDEILSALKLIAQNLKIVSEPAGAASIAAVLNNKFDINEGANVVCVISGGNIDHSLLSKILRDD